MKNCANAICDVIFKKRLWILWSFCFFVTIRSSEMTEYTLPSRKKFKIFDTKKMVNDGKDWSEFVPRDLLIIPDHRGFLYTIPREVYYVNFGTMYETHPHLLHVHTCTKYVPMLAAAQNGNTLLVVSACNWKKGEKRVAEYIVSHNILTSLPDNKSHGSAFADTMFRRNDFPFPIQAIQLSRTGKLLAIATQAAVHIINLEMKASCRSQFLPRVENNLIVDIALKQFPSQIAAVDSEGRIDIKNISDQTSDLELGHIKGIVTDAIDIKRIHFFDSGNLLFATDDGSAKIIEVANWLEHSKGAVTARTFSYDPKYNNVDVDQDTELAAVHWSDNNQLYKIKVHREHGAMTEKFILKIYPAQDKKDNKYSYITPHGKEARAINHWLRVALRGNYIIGLLTDGTVHLWVLPDKIAIPSESDVRTGSDRMDADRLADKRRSTSSPIQLEVAQRLAEKHKLDKNPDKTSTDKSVKRRSLVHHIKTSAATALGGEKGDRSRGESREQSPVPVRTSSSKRRDENLDSPKRDFVKEPSLPTIISTGESGETHRFNGGEDEQGKAESRGRDKDSLRRK